MQRTSPPRLARWLLRIGLWGNAREVIVGDLEEEFGQTVLPSCGWRASRAWFWRQALRSLAVYWRSILLALLSSRGGSGQPQDHGCGGRRSLLVGSGVQGVLQDLRYAFRFFRRNPWFTAVAVLTLSLGIGGTTAVFGFARWLLFRPLPGVLDSDRVGVILFARELGGNSWSPSGLSYLNHADLTPSVPALSGMAGFQRTTIHVAAEGVDARTLQAEFVMFNYFDILGLRPTVGRRFLPEDERDDQHINGVIISHRLWASFFQRADDVLDRTLRVNGISVPIVGVAPQEYHGTERLGQVDLWLPGASYFVAHHWDGDILADRSRGLFQWHVTRLAAEATFDIAQDQLTAGTAGLAEAYPDINAKYQEVQASLYPGIGIHPRRRQQVEEVIALMAGGVALVLLLACANVANLLLFRGIRQQGETAMRRALGASTFRIAQYRFTESLLIAGAGGVGGIMVALGFGEVFKGTRLQGVGEVGSIELEWPVLVVTAAVALGTALFFGIVPAVSAGRVNFAATLQSAARSVTRRPYLRQALSVSQFAAATTLLIGTFLLLGTIRRLIDVDLGFEAQGVTTFLVSPENQGYTTEESLQYERELARRIRQVPGVSDVAVSGTVPFGSTWSLDLFNPQRTDDTVHVNGNVVAGDLFAVLRLPIRSGRGLTAAETFGGGDGPVPVVLSDSLARRLFGTADAVGRIVMTRAYIGRPSREHVVVGVVGDSRWTWVEFESPPLIYMPLASSPYQAGDVVFFVRSAQSAGELGPQLREMAASLDASLPLADVQPLLRYLDRWLADRRVLARLLTALSVIGAVLAAIGLYALVAFSVVERTREFGIRVALGAEARRVMRLVFRQTAALATIGIVVGLVGAAVFSQWLKSRLYGVDPLEPGVYLLAVACLTVVALLAGLAPARAATRVDPMVALRSE